MSVVSNEGRGPEGVHTVGAEDNIGVIQLVIVGNPASNKSPERLHSVVGSEPGRFHWLAACTRETKYKNRGR